MAFSLITSLQRKRRKLKTVTNSIFLCSNITRDSDCSNEVKKKTKTKKTLAPWQKSYDKPKQQIKKKRHTLLTKVHLVKAIIFPVVMYGCESRIIKKAEHQRIDAFELWCWRRLLRVPWTAKRSNQSILKEISPGCSLKGLIRS